MPKILIIRFSSIGDIVLTTPLIRCLKEQLKDAELHFLTKRVFQPVVENNPRLDKVFYLDDDLNAIIKSLKKERYDYILDLHNNLRSFRVKLALGSKNYSFNKLNIEKWLLVRLKINWLPEKHIVERYLETAKPLNIKNDGKGLEYYIPEADKVELSSLPETHRQGYVGFAIGAQHATKRLPPDKIITICKKLNYPVVLLGGKEDMPVAEEIKKQVGPQIYNVCGLYNINQSASLVQQAKTIITHDTGLMHIAAAFNKNIISVWGNTIPEFGMYPYLPENPQRSVIMEVKNLNCRPCSKIGYPVCPLKHFHCMNWIEEDSIAAAVKALP